MNLIALRTSAIVLSLGSVLLSGCAAPFYFAKETRGSVIDSETQQPIEGAVVVAAWILYYPLAGGHRDDLYYAETVTDAQGRYRFDGWGPKFRPFGAALWFNDPLLTAFKSGYKPNWCYNERGNRGFVHSSDCNNKAIALERFDGDSKARHTLVWDLATDICSSPHRYLPKFYIELTNEIERLERMDVREFESAVADCNSKVER